MAQPLPTGWTDTGVVKDFTVTCKIKLRYLPDTAGIPPYDGSHPPPTDLLTLAPFPHFWVYGDADTIGIVGGETIFDARIAGNHTARPAVPGGPIAIYQRVVYLIAPWLPESSPGAGDAKWRQIELVDGVSQGSDSQQYTYTATVTNVRKGSRLVIIDPAKPLPWFWDNYRMEYNWFLDGFSTIAISCAGFGTGTLYWKGAFGSWINTQDVLQAPTGLGEAGPILVRGHGTVDDGVHSQIEFRDIQSDGTAMDTADIHDTVAYVYSAGSGGLDMRTPDVTATARMAAPFKFKYNLGITKFGSADVNAQLRDNFVTPTQIYTPDGSQKTPQATYIQTPYSNTLVAQVTGHERRTKDIAGPLRFDIHAAWAIAQDPVIESDDWQVPIYAAPARIDPASVAPYKPISVKFDSVNVHRPNGLRPSDWITSDGAKLTVTEGSNTLFHCISTGASATRTFLTHWRNWCTPGDPHYGTDAYEITKHDFYGPGDDVYGWQHHGWLQFDITAPSSSTLTFTVAGKTVAVADPHDGTPPTIYEVAFTKTYTINLNTGANSIIVDLLFPNEGGPSVSGYYGRVDSLKLEGFNTGDYTLTGMTLLPRQNGFLKCDFGPPVQRGDYDAIVDAQDGAFTLGNWPDKANKTEVGLDGGGVRHILILTSGGAVADNQESLENFWKRVHRLEGFTVAFSSAASDAALTDPYGHTMGPGLAEWSWSIAPYARTTPGSNYQPDCSPRVRETLITNGYTYEILVNWPIWGAIEALINQGNGRAPAGVTVHARRADNNAIVATGLTGPDGYLVLTPIRDGRTYKLEVAGNDGPDTVFLKPHDLRRLHATEPATPGKKWPNNWIAQYGRYCRVDVRDGNVWFRGSFASIPPFDLIEAAVNSSGISCRPVVAQENYIHRLHALWFEDPSGVGSGPFNTYKSFSDSDGRTWSTPEVVIAGGKYPDIAIDRRAGAKLFCALVGTVVSAVLDYNGQISTYNFKDDSGSTLHFEDDTVAIAWSPLDQERFTGAFHIQGESQISEWFSTNYGQHWKRVV